jgi:tol-pal system protein YbgF
MKKPVCLGAAAAFIAWMAAPPVVAQNREHQQLAAEARMLQEQTQQLAIAIAALNESLKAINARLDDSNNAARKAFADQKLLIDNIGNDVRVVRERTDDTNVRIATLREELEALRTSVLQMQQTALTPAPAVDPSVPVDPNAPPLATTAPPAPAPLPSTLGLSPTRLFETARSDYFAGQLALAISGFEQFLKAFPRSESAGEAQFYIGESYYQQNKWPEAVAAYNLVVQNYPMSSAVPEAYYKRGVAQERLQQPDAARASYETVLKMFPDSDGARLAKQSLDRLRTQRP